MEREILNLQYNHACLIIKAVNSSVSIEEAATKLGLKKGQLYDMIRIYNLKMKRGSCYIRPNKVRYKTLEGAYLEADPV